QFQLFDSIKETQQGLDITLKFTDANNLPTGAGILFKGHGIGRINNIRYDSENQLFIAQASINPEFSEFVTEKAQFWIEKTSVSFSKIENIGNIVTGDYIGFAYSENYLTEKQKTEFTLRNNHSPAKGYLSVTLITNTANGLSEGAPVSYKGLIIGKIDSLTLTKDSEHIKAILQIDNEYSYLVSKQSKFHLLSGVDFKASLKGIEVNSKPLQNIIQGGVALYNQYPVNKQNNKKTLKDNQLFHLYPSKEMANIGNNVFAPPLKATLLSKELPSVSVGSPVYYHKLQVGEVSDMELHNSGLMQTSIEISAQFKHLISENTVFWNVSGFNIDAGLSGVKVNAESILSIAAGGIALELYPSATGNITSQGQYRLFDSFQEATTPPKQITLTYDDAFDLKVGNKIKLKGLEIGEISNLTLNSNNKVIVDLEIDPTYFETIAKKGSRFWIVRSEISLSGAKNLSTLIGGVFINVSPGTGQLTDKFIGESHEPLITQNKTGLPITLLADNAGSTDIASPVYYRQIQIGEVMNKQLNDDASGVEIMINIYPEYTYLIRDNSVFWPASGFNLDIGITGAALKATSLTSLIKGGINMSTPDDQPLQPASKAFAQFAIQTEAKEKWLQWKLKIPNSN
ncbi:MlaD family protein, partial [Psychromonas sp.]|nr:MlaD family protein [Psychromonas sp.]